jgi:hypothetical protein
MKYSQFLEFSKLLETNKTDMDSWRITRVQLVKEADEYQPAEAEKKAEGSKDTLDTKKGNIITKRGRARKALNGQAKKLQERINDEVASKFLKPIFDLKVQVYKKMAEVGKGKQPKEIIAALKMDLQNIQKIQTKQMAAVEKHAQTSIDNTTKKIDSALSKKGLKETTMADLQSYWSLLTTQIMMNLLQKIAVQDDKVIGTVIKDQDILKAAKQINAALNKGQKKKEAELKQKADEKKKEIKSKDEAEGKEEKPAETPAEEPKK